MTTESSIDSGDVQSTITAYWNERSASYDAERGHYPGEAAERAAWASDMRALLPPPPARVLDVGAGTGFMSVLLAGMGYDVTGLDPAAEMLAAARARAAGRAAPPRFQVGDGHAPPFPDAGFDLVVNRHVLWTLRDPARAFAGWLRVLRPGGRLLAIDSLWFADQQPDNNPRDRPEYWQAWQSHYSDAVRAGLPLMDVTSLDPALAHLREAGFTDVEVVHLTAVERFDRENAQPSRGPLPRTAITGMKQIG